MYNQQAIDKHFMNCALELATFAADSGEVPVGAVIVRKNTIVAKGSNSPIADHDPTAHAEIIAIRKATAQCANYRTPDTTLYVTLEPCIMCMGAIIQARIGRLVFGAYDAKTGAAGSCYSIGQDNLLNHSLEIAGGINEQQCAILLKKFFKIRRKKGSKNN